MSTSAMHMRSQADPFGFQKAGLANLEGMLVAAVVFLAPMNHLRLDAVYVTASDIMAIAALILMLARNRIPVRFFGPATAIWLVSFIAFAGGLTLGSLIKGDPLALPNVLLQYGFSLLVLPMLLSARPYPQVIALCKVLILSLIVVMLFGVYVVHFADNPSRHLISGNGRLRSLIERENELAVHGAIAIFFLIGLYKLGEAKATFVLLGLPVLLYGIMLTGSVTGLLVTTAGVAILIFLFGPMSHILISIGVLVIMALVMVSFGDLFMPDIFRERVLAPLLARDLESAGNFTDRQLLLREALHMLPDSLVIGLGVDQFREVSSHRAHVHNAYILAFAEGGLIAMLGLIGLFFTGIYLVWSVMLRGGHRKSWAITLTVLLVYIATFNTFPTFYARFWNVPLILAFAICTARLIARPSPAQVYSNSYPGSLNRSTST